MNREKEIITNFVNKYKTNDISPFGYGKILNHLDTVVGLQKSPTLVVPITLELHLTNRCSHNCLFCMYKKEVRESKICNAELSFEEASSIINDCYTMGVKAITYSGGGEPTLHPFFCSLSSAGKMMGLNQGLITNGSQLGNSAIRQCILNNFDWVRISIDAGSDDIYKQMHGKNCSFSSIIKNLKLLVKENNNRTKIGISFLLTSLNYCDMIKLYNIVSEIGVDYLQIKPMIMSEKDKIKYNNYISEDIIKELEYLLNESKNGKTKLYILFDQFKNIIGSEHCFDKCFGHPLYPVIAATGEIFVCCMHLYNKNKCYGQIKDNSFKDIWISENRYKIGSNINIKECPSLCRIGKTNSVLHELNKVTNVDINFLN